MNTAAKTLMSLTLVLVAGFIVACGGSDSDSSSSDASGKTYQQALEDAGYEVTTLDRSSTKVITLDGDEFTADEGYLLSNDDYDGVIELRVWASEDDAQAVADASSGLSEYIVDGNVTADASDGAEAQKVLDAVDGAEPSS